MTMTFLEFTKKSKKFKAILNILRTRRVVFLTVLGNFDSALYSMLDLALAKVKLCSFIRNK